MASSKQREFRLKLPTSRWDRFQISKCWIRSRVSFAGDLRCLSLAAEIATATLQVRDARLTIECEVHTGPARGGAVAGAAAHLVALVGHD